jgi:DNA-binding Lrp family transcriptional regulator
MPAEEATVVRALSAVDRRLLNDFQHDFPLAPRPFAEIAVRLGTDENTVIETFARLQAERIVSRIGATVTPHKMGWSTLAAMAVPADRIEDVAALINGYDEVNHNYEREHDINIWFVATAESREKTEAVLEDIARRSGIEVLDLPLEEAYRLDLGFPLQWN